jgi:hypothetical protein
MRRKLAGVDNLLALHNALEPAADDPRFEHHMSVRNTDPSELNASHQCKKRIQSYRNSGLLTKIIYLRG